MSPIFHIALTPELVRPSSSQNTRGYAKRSLTQSLHPGLNERRSVGAKGTQSPEADDEKKRQDGAEVTLESVMKAAGAR